MANRRDFLKVSTATAGGFLLSFWLPENAPLAAQQVDGIVPGAQLSTAPRFNAFIRIAPDESVTFQIHKAEMGQGTLTSLPQLLAEELDCDWKKIRTEFPGVEPEYGPMMGVYGSLSIRTSWVPLRKAGAAAREMLVEAAARQWRVEPSACSTDNGFVINNATGARLSYGSLAEAAAKIPPPANPTLKDPAKYKLIGTSPKKRDTPGKIAGKTIFGIDVVRPGMLYATLQRCPVFGGTVASFDAAKAKAVPGVKHVVRISNGVAVVADSTWAAIEGRKALTVQFDEGPRAVNSTASLRQMFADLATKPGASARREGDAEPVLAAAAKKIESVYEAPYLSHAPMEPMNCVAEVTADGCDVWASTQIQQTARDIAAMVTGLPKEKVRIHTQYIGGGFGRRGRADFIAEGVEIAMAVKAPVKLTWTRDDDLQHDTYRPGSYTKLAAALGPDGMPTAWTGRVVCQSFAGLRNGVDGAAVEGVADMPYSVPNISVDYHNPDTGIPCSYWRSVGYSQNTFFTESFTDELAHAAGKDPVEFRRALLRKNPRLLGVLNLVAEKAGWGKPLPAGRHRGVAVVNNIGSYNAQVAEVSAEKGKIRVHRVVCAVDCGVLVNPAIAEQQIQSGIVYGLSAALKQAITMDHGRVLQANFDTFDPLRIDEMPVVEVHFVKSTEAPGGLGEASTPTAAPALANAVFAATGRRVRMLPIRPADLA